MFDLTPGIASGIAPGIEVGYGLDCRIRYDIGYAYKAPAGNAPSLAKEGTQMRSQRIPRSGLYRKTPR